MIPCHRVVGTSGSLTGYAGGLDRKIALLKLEKAYRPHFSFRKKRPPPDSKKEQISAPFTIKAVCCIPDRKVVHCRFGKIHNIRFLWPNTLDLRKW